LSQEGAQAVKEQRLWYSAGNPLNCESTQRKSVVQQNLRILYGMRRVQIIFGRLAYILLGEFQMKL
jgi:hypothetical protein